VSRKIEIINSPWGRGHERVSDCARWVECGYATIEPDGRLRFTTAYVSEVRAIRPFDVAEHDGIERRWRVRPSAGCPVLQLLPGVG
jgi:hypothetical protein